MKSNIYALYDSKAEVYLRPFFVTTDALALRGFEDLVNSGDDQPAKTPEDFTLFRIGMWTDVKGVIQGITPAALANGMDVKRKRPTPAEMDQYNTLLEHPNVDNHDIKLGMTEAE